jgi:hypothetical protein
MARGEDGGEETGVKPDRWRQLSDEAKARVAARDSAQRVARRAASSKRLTQLWAGGAAWLQRRFPATPPLAFSPQEVRFYSTPHMCWPKVSCEALVKDTPRLASSPGFKVFTQPSPHDRTSLPPAPVAETKDDGVGGTRRP